MDMKRTDLALLLSLDVLLEEQHVTRAAQRLHLSQSAMSSQLARLRLWFDDPLLIPSGRGRGMALTPRAQSLQRRLHAALQGVQESIAPDVFDPLQDTQTFTVAANDNAFVVFVRRVGQLLVTEAPHIRLRCIAPNHDDLASRMERGELDLYVGAARMVPPSLKQRTLLHDTFRVARRIDDTSPMDLATYVARPHVMVSPDGQFFSAIDSVLAGLQRKRNVTMTVTSYTQAAITVAGSNALATLPGAFLASMSFPLRIDPPPFVLDAFDYVMAWHPRVHDAPSHRWLRERFLATMTTPGSLE